jgi:hypothetical protein
MPAGEVEGGDDRDDAEPRHGPVAGGGGRRRAGERGDHVVATQSDRGLVDPGQHIVVVAHHGLSGPALRVGHLAFGPRGSMVSGKH